MSRASNIARVVKGNEQRRIELTHKAGPRRVPVLVKRTSSNAEFLRKIFPSNGS